MTAVHVAWTVAYGASGLAYLVVGSVVYLSRPRLLQNRFLAATLILEAASLAFDVFGEWTYDPALYYALRVTNWTLWVPAAFMYLGFLGTLDSPLGRPFRGRVAVATLIALAVLSAVLLVVRSDLFFESARATPGGAAQVRGPLNRATGYFWGAAAFYSILVAWDAWRRAPQGSAAKGKLAIFAAAFLARDLHVVVASGTARELLALLPGSSRLAVTVAALTALPIIFAALVGYGVIRYQLFSIDLRLKRTLRGSTIGAIFIATFFVASETAAQFFSERAGSVYVGIATAGLLVFALAPLQRLAERLANTAMPRVAETPEYIAQRKLDVYRAALEGALADGHAGPKERDMLQRLQLELGLSNAEVRALEERTRAAFGIPSAPHGSG